MHSAYGLAHTYNMAHMYNRLACCLGEGAVWLTALKAKNGAVV